MNDLQQIEEDAYECDGPMGQTIVAIASRVVMRYRWQGKPGAYHLHAIEGDQLDVALSALITALDDAATPTELCDECGVRVEERSFRRFSSGPHRATSGTSRADTTLGFMIDLLRIGRE